VDETGRIEALKMALLRQLKKAFQSLRGSEEDSRDRTDSKELVTPQTLSLNDVAFLPAGSFPTELKKVCDCDLVSREKKSRTVSSFDREGAFTQQTRNESYELWTLRRGKTEISLRYLVSDAELDLDGDPAADALKFQIWKAFHSKTVGIKAELADSVSVVEVIETLKQSPVFQSVRWDESAWAQEKKDHARGGVSFCNGETPNRVRIEICGAQTRDLGNSISLQLRVPYELFPEITDSNFQMISNERQLEVAGLPGIKEELEKIGGSNLVFRN
jgi:hypothetical protein